MNYYAAMVEVMAECQVHEAADKLTEWRAIMGTYGVCAYCDECAQVIESKVE